MDMNNNDLIFSGTKDVAENLKFDEARLQEWFGDHLPETGKIIQIAQFKGGQSNPTYKISTEKKGDKEKPDDGDGRTDRQTAPEPFAGKKK